MEPSEPGYLPFVMTEKEMASSMKGSRRLHDFTLLWIIEDIQYWSWKDITTIRTGRFVTSDGVRWKMTMTCDAGDIQFALVCEENFILEKIKKMTVSFLDSNLSQTNVTSRAPGNSSPEVKPYLTLCELLNDNKHSLVNGDLILFFKVTATTEWAVPTPPVLNNTSFVENLTKNLRSLLVSGSFSDFKIHAKGTEHLCHKFVLSCRSEFFAAMFQHDFQETKNSELFLSDIEPEVLKKLLWYMYTDQVTIHETDCVGLFIAANKYGLERLERLCEKKIISGLGFVDADEMLRFAGLYNAGNLLRVAKRFVHAFKKHLKAVQANKDEGKSAIRSPVLARAEKAVTTGGPKECKPTGIISYNLLSVELRTCVNGKWDSEKINISSWNIWRMFLKPGFSRPKEQLAAASENDVGNFASNHKENGSKELGASGDSGFHAGNGNFASNHKENDSKELAASRDNGFHAGNSSLAPSMHGDSAHYESEKSIFDIMDEDKCNEMMIELPSIKLWDSGIDLRCKVANPSVSKKMKVEDAFNRDVSELEKLADCNFKMANDLSNDVETEASQFSPASADVLCRCSSRTVFKRRLVIEDFDKFCKENGKKPFQITCTDEETGHISSWKLRFSVAEKASCPRRGRVESDVKCFNTLLMKEKGQFHYNTAQFELSILDKNEEPTISFVYSFVNCDSRPLFKCLTMEDILSQSTLLNGSLILCGLMRYQYPVTYGSVPSFAVPAGKLREDVLSLLSTGANADLVFDVQGQKFLCHKAMLATYPSLYRRFVLSAMQEGQPDGRIVIKVDGLAPDAFKKILQYPYSGRLVDFVCNVVG